jgi:PAS domain-containing protein
LIWAHDLDGQFLFVNPAAAQLLRYAPEEGKARNLREFLAPAIRHFFGDYSKGFETMRSTKA